MSFLIFFVIGVVVIGAIVTAINLRAIRREREQEQAPLTGDSAAREEQDASVAEVIDVQETPPSGPREQRDRQHMQSAGERTSGRKAEDEDGGSDWSYREALRRNAGWEPQETVKSDVVRKEEEPTGVSDDGYREALRKMREASSNEKPES
ncbi:hypothetical protein [Alicyclobacillus fodiniaquatilis]|uniref:Uncharacterized protein n=1 Tax=Alicyclobacillus fodiniaquatilis TaxID=1661150 RepID=A0ABW4JA90_9BACL